MRNTAWLHRGAALLVSPFLCIQACATSTGKTLAGSSYPSVIVEGTVEVRADLSTAQYHDIDAQKLRAVGVIPLRLFIQNMGINQVIIRSAVVTLELSDGRSLKSIPIEEAKSERATAPPYVISERPTESSPPSQEGGKFQESRPEDVVSEQPTESQTPMQDVGRSDNDARPSRVEEFFLELLHGYPFGTALAIITAPIWVPGVLISHYVNPRNNREDREGLERDRRWRLEHHGYDIYLGAGEAVGGVLYFASDSDLSATSAMATVVVPVRRADTGEEHVVRLPLGEVR